MFKKFNKMKFISKGRSENKKRLMLERLSVKDKKLIQLLFQDARMPITQLAKKLQISKSAIVQKISALRKKGVLMDPIMYTNIKISDESFYAIEISTLIEIENEEITEKLLKIKGMAAIFWYNGNFNLVMSFYSNDPQETIDEIEKIIKIKKFKIRKLVDSWFHPPHLFEEAKDKKIEFKRIAPKIDETDKKIIKALEENPIAPYVELCDKTKLAPLTLRKRLDRLEREGAITDYCFFVDPWYCGKDVFSISAICKGKKKTERLVKYLLSTPQTGNIWEYDHEWNLNFVLWVDEQFEANKIINNILKNFEILEIDVSILAAFVGNE